MCQSMVDIQSATAEIRTRTGLFLPSDIFADPR